MSEGLKALLEAAQFIEQQEKLKLSPQATAIPAILNEQQHRFIVHAYDATIAAAAAASVNITNNTTTTTTTNGHLNGGNINIRNSNIRHGNAGSLQVSSSAPAAAATFQHVNGHHSHHNNNNNNNGNSINSVASSLHPSSLHATTKVLTNGTNIASASLSSSSSSSTASSASSSSSSTTSNGHQQQHHHPLHHHPHLNHLNNHHQQISQLLNANHHDYEFNGNGNGSGDSVSSVPTSSSCTGATSGNLLQQSSLNGRSNEGRIAANNHHQLHVQNGNNNNNSNSMMVDEISPTHSSFATNSSSSQNSPPRHVSSSSLGSSAGSHYMHMINAAGSQQSGVIGSGANHIAHATPRRRTISSTSNGAGTREVHNKLEKNRRAHLKECYESLKNQLSLKDEDRRKTSNLAILGEALKCVQSFQKRNQELEAEWEHLANDKINFQKRIVSLKRELGPKYEQVFSGIFPDIEIGSIPSERETINDTHSLSSGRGSTLYSSSSSLSSGGSSGSSSSSGSNTMSSPVGAGLQTAMPTTISPVINKLNNNNSNNINSTSPILINSNSNVVIQQQQHQRKNSSLITTTIQTVTIPTQGGNGGGGMNSPSAGSPTALVTFGSSLPLSLTAKNISATAVTRGSPTPSTPSPSPSSSSGVSSSSSLISSSPPINGVISNGRNVTVNIPNGLKVQSAAAAVAGIGLNGNGGSSIIGGNGTSTSASATVLTTSIPAQGVNNTNNGVLGTQPQQQHNSRKKNLASSNNNSNNNNNAVADLKYNNNNHQNQSQQLHHQQQQQQQHVCEDGEQPAKFLKVFNTSTATINGHHHQPQPQLHEMKTHGQKLLLTSSNGGILQNGGCGGNNNITNNVNIGGSIAAAATAAAINKSFNNSNTASYAATPATITSSSTSELCRLPGGAELNILPSNGLKVSSSSGAGPIATTALYHPNGKITFVNGPPPHHHPHQYQYQHPPSSPLPNSTTITSNGTPTITNGFLIKDATSVTPLLVTAASSSTTASVNGLHFAGNFAQLLATANNSATINNGAANATAVTTSIMPMATNFQNISETKTKNNNKSPIVTWRSGAATTN